MQAFFASIFDLFLSPAGVAVLGALDASMVFFLPAAVDMAVILMSAEEEYGFFTYPALAVLGSTVGGAVTFMIGRKVGEANLGRWISENKLDRIRDRIGRMGVVGLGLAALMPPPFPLTPFVLASGALGMSLGKFLLTMAVARLARFGTEAALAYVYGDGIIAVMRSPAFETAVSVLMVLAIGGTTVAIVRLFRQTGRAAG